MLLLKLLCISICWTACWTYHVVIPSNIPHGTEVFNSSLVVQDLGHTDYVMQQETATRGKHNQLPFFVDKYTGVIYYVPAAGSSDRALVSFTFDIVVSGGDSYLVIIPLQVMVVDYENWQQIFNNFSLRGDAANAHRVSILVHGVNTDLHYNGLMSKQMEVCPNLAMPQSICKCKVRKNHIHSLTSASVVTTMQFSLKISDCRQENTFVPSQKSKVTVKFLSRKQKLPSMLLNSRRKRNTLNAIHFNSSSFTVSFQENMPIGSLVTMMNAYDSTGPVHLDVVYGLEAMENRRSLEMFSIDRSTGAVHTTSDLDREDMPRHKFRVTAMRANFHQARCVLTINVKDQNDNSPQFEQSPYQLSLPENQPNGTVIFRITAYDADADENGRIRFSITRSVPPTSVFAITNDGNLLVNGIIDRELESHYQLTVEARDGGHPSRFQTVRVIITIEDKNDNTPQFTEAKYISSVKEDLPLHTVIVTVSAIDKDSGSNGDVSYSLLRRNNKFAIDSKTGAITLKAALDYEEAHLDSNGVYTLHVRASDNGLKPRYNTSGLVVIHVLDVNDNTPRFVSSPYHQWVREDTPVYTQIGQVEAIDSDYGANAHISYTIVRDGTTGSRPFRIDQSTGIIRLLHPLDHEEVTSYHFSVRASDSGQPRKFVDTEFTVDVQDVNDNAPHFTANKYEAKLAENARIGQEVLRIEAEDPDTQTVNIRYHIIGGDRKKKFRITTRDGYGLITLANRLDYNEQRSYKLVVNASDGKLQNSTIVYINVTDTNSHQPVFDKSNYVLSLSEDIPIGTEVLTVHASDDDVGDNARITYCFIYPVTKFDINPQNGTITTKEVLDYESDSIIRFNVQAHDNGIPQRDDITEVVIYLEDANDNAPVFDKTEYYGSISEEANANSKVLKIHATDSDSGRNGRLHYTLGDNDSGDFSIERPSGMIRTAHTLDRESVSNYTLIAYAVDGGTPPLSTSVTVFIGILDVDDNPPAFDNDTWVYRVREDVSVGAIVARIQATDPDLQTNSRIIYDLGHDPEVVGQWQLDSETGELSVLHKLDYETRKSYTILVSASSNQLVNQATVHIIVEDCNDNTPVINNFEIVFNNYRMPTRDSFPMGIIGRVPAYDPDVSDTLTYKFLSGNHGNLLLMNASTGDLWLNTSLDSNRQFTTLMIIQVSDGSHKAKASCTLRVTGITEEMLQHSITVRVLHMNAYTFLSPVMYQFVDGLAKILNTTSSNVYVFNVQNDTDVEREILNVSFSARKDHNSFFSSKYLQDQVYLNRLTLVKLTTKNVLPFDDNICLREPCQNYKRCTSVLTFDSSAPFVSSAVMIFRPIYPVYRLKCECPIGFTNDETCSDEVDLCYSNPCENSGQCISTEGGYACICKEDFAGVHCEIDMKKGQCINYSGICKNGGSCTDMGPDKFSCVCSGLGVPLPGQEEMTKLCELRSRQFKPGNFLMLPGITNQWHFTLSISFSTVVKNGLIFFNGRLNHEHDFIAIELINGQVHLNFSTGESWTVVDPYVEGGLNDGQWHTVYMQYYNEAKPGPLPHGVLNREGPSSNKIVVVTIDPDSCDDVVAANWNSTLGSYTCSKKVKQTGSKNSLDLTSPLLLGGVPDLPEDYQVHFKTYDGCLRDLIIDGHRLDLAQYIANNGSSPGCSSMRSRCSPSSCFNQAKCATEWNDYKCLCKDGYTGGRCQHESNFVGQLHGNGCLKYLAVNEISTFRLPWHQSISFRTVSTNAILVYVAIGVRASIQVTMKIEGGRILYEVERSRSIERVTLMRTPISDGEWHEVKVQWIIVDSTRARITLTLDEGIEQSHIQFSSNSLSRMKISSLYIGGKLTTDQTVDLSYQGCLQNIQLGPDDANHRIDKEKLREVGDVTFSSGCKSDLPCQSNPCPVTSNCITKWSQYECQCHKGYVGDQCESVCSLNVCQNGAICHLNSTSEYGYHCECAKTFYGMHCQYQYTESCPAGWFRNPLATAICAPCNCSNSDNFASTCDKKTGHCLCKKNHYYVPSTKSCKQCNCYHIGSVGSGCNKKGQCSCKPTVVGRQCNYCTSELAEVTSNGCEVLYVNCPRAWYQKSFWPRTEFGQRSPTKCPGNSLGFAFRTCVETGWLEPDFSNCTSEPFYQFSVELNNIESGKNHLTLYRSRQLAYNLSKAFKMTSDYYEKDIINSYQLIKALLDHESDQSEFGLASAYDKDFTEHLVDASSALFNNNSLQYWLNQEEVDKVASDKDYHKKLYVPLLVQSWEKYLTTMLENFKLIYYDSYIAKSSNMNMNMQTVTEQSLKQTDFLYSNELNEDESDISLKLPTYLFMKQNRFKQNYTIINDQSADVGIITYKNVNNIFPCTFEDDRTFRIPRKPSINSAVVSVQVHKNSVSSADGMIHKLTEPITLTFRLLNTDAIEPQCVFWNFTARSTGLRLGGWSHKGFTKATYNDTHVICQCYHLTTFAVITDEEISSVTSRLPVRIVMVICVSVSTMLLLVTIIASVALPGVISVRAVINRNLSISVVLSNLLYLIGIQQTSNIYWCMAIAVGLHFLLMSAFSWVFVDGLHLYRKLTERRDINRGHTRIYYIVGWIVPAVITALSVGLDAKGYGNTAFCWISMDDLLIWSFAGPVFLCCIIYITLFIMSVQVFLSSKRVDMKRKELSYEMKASFFIAPTIMCTWAFALFAVNFNTEIYFYIFSIINVMQGILVFVFYCFCNEEIRQGYRKYKLRLARKSKQHNTTTQQLLQASLGRTPESSMRDGVLPRFNNSTSESLSLNHTKTNQASPISDAMDVSDSDDSYDDTSSDSSMSLGSSSDDNQVEINTYRNICNTRPTYQSPKVNNHRPYVKRRGNGRLPSNGNSNRNDEINSSRKFIENESDGSLSDGSNETSV